MDIPDTMQVIRPADLHPKDRYKLLIGTVVPRPIGWIGSRSPEGVPNLAPYSFFNVVSSDPATVLFSSGRSERIKDTLANVLASGEFTANIVTEHVAEAMNATSGEYPPDVSEFDVAGLTPIPGIVVAAPMVAETPVRFECRVSNVVDIGPPDRDAAHSVVFGEVVAMHLAERVLDGTRVLPEELKAVGRLAGSGYTTVVDGYFEMDRPIV